MKIVQIANFYGARSGGLRTAVDALGAGYAARGCEVVLVVPGPSAREDRLPDGRRRIVVRAPRIPGTGGYRAVDPWRVERLLGQLRPDVVEVSDRLTLRGLGRWAGRRGVRSVMIAHERLDRLLGQFLLPVGPSRRVADAANGRTAADFDAVVCTTAFARAEFDRIGARNVHEIPLGVDLSLFSPRHHDLDVRDALAGRAEALLVHAGRLSPEKHPERSIDAVAVLHAAGCRVRLVVAGDGPRRRALQRRAAGLPVVFTGFIAERPVLARLLASADVALAPGPHETFGLAALEALASGTPAIVSASSALPEVVGTAGAVVTGGPAAFADGIVALLSADEDERRSRARARAEQFGWPSAVDGMLTVLRAA